MGLENPTPKKLTIGAQRVSSLKIEDQREIRKKQSETEVKKPKKPERISARERQEQEQNLQFGEITSIEELEGSSSKVFVIELENGDKAIAKIVNLDDEKYAAHKTELHAAQSERAAYLVSMILGFNFVPTTVIREKLDHEGTNKELQQIDDELGEDDRIIVQKFAKGKTAAQQSGIPVELLTDVAVFDYVISNVDRNTDNYLYSKNQITAIDNELSFGEDGFKLIIDDLRSAAATTIKISENLNSIIQDYDKNRNSRETEIYMELESLMPKEYIDAAISRLEQITDLILKHGHVPAEKVGDLTFK